MSLKKVSEFMIDDKFTTKVNNHADKLNEHTGKLTEVATQLAQNTLHLEEIEKVITPNMDQSEIQTLLDKTGKFKFKKGIYNIQLYPSNTGLFIRSNSTVEFEDGAILQAIGTSLGSYRVIRILNSENIRLINPLIIGERDTHIGTTGEWGMGISIEYAKNIRIDNPTTNNCWGDGIYIGDGIEDLEINNPKCDNNRRQGISVISGKRLIIRNPICTNTNGIAPEAGIDIEPNAGTTGLENVVITNPYTENNASYGIVIALAALADTNKVVDILIDNHRDVGSNYNFAMEKCFNLKGNITVNQPTWISSKRNAFYCRNFRSTSPQVIINNPTIVNPFSNAIADQTSPVYGSIVSILREASDENVGSLGNILINNLNIIKDGGFKAYANVSVSDNYNSKAENVIINGIVGLSDSVLDFYTRGGQGVFDVKGYEKSRELNIHQTTNNNTVIANYINSIQTDWRNVTLAENTNIGVVVNITHRTGSSKTIIIPVNQLILTETSLGEKLSTSTKGSSISLKKISSNEWVVLSKIGTWIKENI